MKDFALSSLLLRGTKTWQGGEFKSTIDLVLASKGLAISMIKCITLKTDYRSDHQAIETVFSVAVPEQQQHDRLLLKNAPWKDINTRIAQTLERLLTDSTVQ